jgi:hypothetical protein
MKFSCLLLLLVLSPAVPAQDSRPMVYAAFKCHAGSCQSFGQKHHTGADSYDMSPFQTLAECQTYIRSASSGGKIGADGRIKLGPGSYWDCRVKHVDDWERAD